MKEDIKHQPEIGVTTCHVWERHFKEGQEITPIILLDAIQDGIRQGIKLGEYDWKQLAYSEIATKLQAEVAVAEAEIKCGQMSGDNEHIETYELVRDLLKDIINWVKE